MILECVGRGERLEIVTKVHGDVADRIGKPAETGIIGTVHTDGRAALVRHTLAGGHHWYGALAGIILNVIGGRLKHD